MKSSVSQCLSIVGAMFVVHFAISSDGDELPEPGKLPLLPGDADALTHDLYLSGRRVEVGDLLGATVLNPSGEPLGTIEDVVTLDEAATAAEAKAEAEAIARVVAVTAPFDPGSQPITVPLRASLVLLADHQAHPERSSQELAVSPAYDGYKP